MKKYLSLFIIFSFILSTGVVFAEESTQLPGNGLPKGVRPGIPPKEDLQNRIEEKREMVDDRRESIKERFENRRENLSERKENTKERIEDRKSQMNTMTDEEKKAMQEKNEKARKALEERRNALKMKADKMREEAKSKMVSLKEKAKDAKSLKRYETRENILNRFDNQVSKTLKFRDRLQNKITEAEAKGVDTSSSKTHVANADVKLEEVKTKIAEMNSVLVNNSSELTTESKTKIQTLAKETSTLLKEAYGQLNLGVKALKDVLSSSDDSNTNESSSN